MNETFFRIATALVIVGSFGMSGYFRNRAQRKGGRLRSQAGSKLVALLRLAGLAVVLMLFAYIVNPDRVAALRVSLPDWLRAAAVVVAAINMVLMLWMFRALGNNISPLEEARERATLVTHGPYRWIRHPLYTFGAIGLLALMFISGLWLFGAFVAPGIIYFARWRVPREEANLIAVFGDAYRDYMTHTGAFLPKWPGRLHA